MTDTVIENGKCYVMKINKENKYRGNDNLKTTIPSADYEKQVENLEYFNYLGSMITNVARCTREIKS